MKKKKFVGLLVLAAGSFAAGLARADAKSDQTIAKAEEQFAKGKPDDAIKSLLKLVGNSPSVEAYLALAHIQELNGNGDEAAESTAKAVEISASASPSLKAQAFAASARLALGSGTGKTALDMATKAVAAEKNAGSLAALASAQARAGDAKSADAAADAAIVLDSVSSVAHQGKGDAMTASGQIAEAVAAYRKATELDPKNTTARVGLAYSLVAVNKSTEARAVALKATEMDKNSGAAYAVLGYAISAEKKFNGNDASWSDAIAQAQQGAFLAPKNPQVQMVVAQLFEARGNYDQAQVAYQTILTNDPGFTAARIAIINTKFRRGNLDGAVAEAAELVKANPESAEANRMYGEFLARKGMYKEAIPHLEKATAAMPRSGDAFAMLAHSYHMTRSFEDAKEAYAKAVQLNPADDAIKSNYGLLLGMSGEADKGAQVLAALTATPDYKSAAGFANYGWVLSRMKPPKADAAIAAYRKAIELEPTNAGLYYGMGWAQYYAQHYPDAIAAFDKAGSMDKALYADTRSGVGWSQYFIAVNADKTNPNFAKTKEAEAAGETAGRPDARLIDAVARYEKAVADGKAAEAAALVAAQRDAGDAGNDAVDIGKLSRQLQKGSITQRVDAANALAAAGADAAEILGYALETDSVIAVRQAAGNSLRRMGAGARKALPALRRYAATQQIANPMPSKDEMALEFMESDLRNVIQEIIRKLK
ncbi:MAG: tetratricopeptide repeat protein [Vicinamibacteria bacterium]|nr:tetratricopeptide repeat protein [Vicinamibacteria bacterium]